MAQYNLPQFSTSPTPSYQQQPIIKLPNYGDIYARNFSIGQQTAAIAFKPIREAIDKYVEKKEKEEIERKKEEERVFNIESRIADNTIAYQGLIADQITQQTSGEFEGQIEDMLYASVDGYAANERAYKLDRSITAQEYTKIKSRYIKEISDMKTASQGLMKNLEWYSQNNGKLSRYNDPKLIGLIEAQRNNELNIGRNAKGGLTVYYDDLLGNKTVYTIDDLKVLSAEDSVITRLDFEDREDNDNIGNAIFTALEDEIGTQLGVYTPQKTIRRTGDSKSKIQTETEAMEFVAGKKEETIKYLANNSQFLDDSMPSLIGQTWLDEMLYGDNATEQVAQARTDAFVLKYLKEEGVVNPTAAQIKEVEDVMDSYERNAPITELQTKVRDFQIKEAKQFLAEKIWKERYEIQEKPMSVTTLINESITESDENEDNKILYAKGLTTAVASAANLQVLAASNDEDAYKDEIKMRSLVNSTLGLNATNGVRTGELTENANGDFELTYELPESIYGKNQTLVINKGTTKEDLFAFRNIAFGTWTKGIDNTRLINGITDYFNDKDTEDAKYYEETITGIGGALISKDAPSSTPTTTESGGMSDNQKLIKRRRWIRDLKKFEEDLENNPLLKNKNNYTASARRFSETERVGGRLNDDIVETKEFAEKYPNYPAELYGQEDKFGKGEELAAAQASEALSAENQRKKDQLFANQGRVLTLIEDLEAENGDLGPTVELQILQGEIPSGLKIPEKYSFLRNN
jgi:hypothetical protein